ncbi:type III-B CRISPR module-associated protein Cmr5 [Clostridium luticellarii]|uniref:CRISPR type III-B/RAMP module-associated protein Cmr5 n=1 Tax=Clostridium luticellarii TaxID=1691940 RepID=A0A2T0B6B1_9CLOT|nr:type III-B CRISPR module-associated protein Cmr5 [Clostridium luticellarii]PRR79327.1 CRISPR-associated protein Cmr5 [Clostridium luticellarii]
MTSLKDANLEIAQFALECVLSVTEDADKDTAESEGKKESQQNHGEEKTQEKYKTLAKKIPVMVQKNGLMNTLAFIFSKHDKEEYEKVFDQIREWSIKNPRTEDIEVLKNLNINVKNDKYIGYLKAVYGLSPKEYRLLTKEIIILFSWIKRFADGSIESENIEGEKICE